MKRFSLWGLIYIAAVAATGACGAVLQVPGEHNSIQSAINAAAHGDVVLVSPGEYEENVDFSGKNIVLTSLDPNDPNIVAETIIYREPERSRRGLPIGTEGNGSIVTFMGGETAEAMLTGFTIKYGHGTHLGNNEYFGGGVLCVEASPTITKNVIRNHLGEDNEGRPGTKNCFGAAVCCIESNASITHNILTENSSFLGAAVCCIASPEPMIKSRLSVTNNLISGNTANQGAGISCIRTEAFIAYNTVTLNEAYIGAGVLSVDGPTTVYSNLIIDNTADICGGVYLRGGQLVNNTLIRNTATEMCGHLFLDTRQIQGIEPHVASNIFYKARAGGIVVFEDQVGGISFIHNSLFENIPGDFTSFLTGEAYDAFPEQIGNISEDPLFVDASQGDYHLQDGSLCIDAGDPVFEPNATWVDMDGNPRVSGAAVDIGMFENTRCTAPVAHAGPDQVVLIGQEVMLDGTASVFCDPNQLQMFIWDQSAGPSARLSNPRAQQPSFSPELPGEYRFELMVFDGDNVSRADEVLITVLSELPAGVDSEPGEAFDPNQGL